MQPPVVRQNHYWHQVLGVPCDASMDTIKAAYKKQALIWHPDRHADDKENATRQFVEINNAYKALIRAARPAKSFETVITHHVYLSRPDTPIPPRRRVPIPRTSSSTMNSAFSSEYDLTDVDSSRTAVSSPPSSRCSSEDLAHVLSERPPMYGAEPAFASRPSISKPQPPIPGLHRSASLHRPFIPMQTRTFVPPVPSVPLSQPRPTPSRLRKPQRQDIHTRPSTSQTNPITERLTTQERPRQEFATYRNQAPRPPTPTPHHPFTPNLPSQTRTHTYGPPLPLSTLGVGTSKEWKYTLTLTLEDLFHGASLRFRITRINLSGLKTPIIVPVDVPPGTLPGTRIVCRGVGHERRDGSFQNIVFVVEEKRHERFGRWGRNSNCNPNANPSSKGAEGDLAKGDLVMDVRVPWAERLRRQPGKLCFKGVDGADLAVRVDWKDMKALRGTSTVFGAGMPVVQAGKVVRRGNIIVRWEIVDSPASTKWNAFKTMLHFGKY